jgi:hypothetical protein
MSKVSVGVLSAALLTNEPFGSREQLGVFLIAGAGLTALLAEPISWWTIVPPKTVTALALHSQMMDPSTVNLNRKGLISQNRQSP